MNEWLTIWLAMIAIGHVAFLSAICFERNNRGIFEGAPAVLLTYLCIGCSGVGILGTLGWLIVWVFGQ